MNLHHSTVRRTQLVILVVILAAALSGCSGRVPDQITPAETLDAKNQGALIVDVRDADDFYQFHIPGSVNIPLAELTNRLDEIPLDEHVVLVCTLGRTSYAARDILLENGYTTVSSMQGGVTAWYDSGYPGISNQ